MSLSDGDRTHQDLVLQHDADDQEDKVEQEHEGAQNLTHFPLASRDGHDDKEEHEEEEDDGTEQAVAAHLHSLEVMDDVVDEPWERQAADRTTTEELVHFLVNEHKISLTALTILHIKLPLDFTTSLQKWKRCVKNCSPHCRATFSSKNIKKVVFCITSSVCHVVVRPTPLSNTALVDQHLRQINNQFQANC